MSARRWRIAAIVAGLALAGAARADLLPPGGGGPTQRSIAVSGVVTAFAGPQLEMREQNGQTTAFQLGTARAEAIGLRAGDNVVVTRRGVGNPFAAPVYTVDRTLPVAGMSVRVYTAGAAAAPAAFAQGTGCWVASVPGAGYEMCFFSISQGVILRYRSDGALACSARVATSGARARWTASEQACARSAPWPLQAVECDARAQSCTLSGGGEERLAFTRR